MARSSSPPDAEAPEARTLNGVRAFVVPGTVTRMTDTPDVVVLNPLPPPCCYTGRDLVVTWAEAWTKRDMGAASAAHMEWLYHQIDYHRVTGVPTQGCPDCLEYVVGLGLVDGQGPDLVTAHGKAAAFHFAEHWVLDPLRAADKAGRAATLPKGEHTPSV